jgi:hypothetical protein
MSLRKRKGREKAGKVPVFYDNRGVLSGVAVYQVRV